MMEGLFKLLMSDYSMPVNLGNPEEISLKEMAEEIIQLTGSSSVLVYKELPVDDPRQRQPDISTASEVLHWNPAVGRKEGLSRTIQYFRSTSV